MSDATLLAGEVADVAAAVGRVAEALAGLRPQVDVAVPAPVVSVGPAPQVTVEAAQVNVPSPVVNVAAPSVSIAAPEAVGYTVRVTERDARGLIVAFPDYADMTASVNTSGSLSTTGSEDTLATVTDAGVYQLAVDLSDMVDAASPDVVTIKIYGKARSSDTERLAESYQFIGSQEKPLWISPPFISPHHYKATITMSTGSATIPWAIYTV